MNPLRIAQIAPPWYPVPPVGYGGIELVVGLLTRQLRAEGHGVLLFAAEGSPLATHSIAPAEWAAKLGTADQGACEDLYGMAVYNAMLEEAPVDVIHDHCGGKVLADLLRFAIPTQTPVIHTVHFRLDHPAQHRYINIPGQRITVALSEAQRRDAEWLAWDAVVPNAVDVDALTVGLDPDSYLLCLARISPEKGQHIAIEVARRAGRKLILAGKVGTQVAYYRDRVLPHIDGDKVVHLHNVAGEDKARLLANATALLAPLQWEEPFGLAMAEAMCSGTPVIAFSRGAAPELITDGVTGWLVDDINEMVAAIGAVSQIHRQACAAMARARFTPARMAAGYLAVYELAMTDRDRSRVA